MPKSKRRTPWEKKQLSRRKDYRDPFLGANDKASRRLVPLRKKQANRALRRNDKSELARDPEQAENRFRARSKSRWKKWPGYSLSESLEIKQTRRARRTNRRKKQTQQYQLTRRLLSGELQPVEFRTALQDIWDSEH